MFFKPRQGQTFIEYTILIGVLVTVLVAMTPMIRRATQSMVKVVSDQVGSQKNSEQVGGRFGYVINSTSASRAQQSIESWERLGEVGKDYHVDRTFTQTNTFLNQGWAEREL